jgi:hypothetical protein
MLLATPGLAVADEHEGFEDASVHFEQNATDGDVEVVFKATGGDEGLAKLTVVGPDGRTVIDFRAPDASTLGIRQFEFESPEPTDVAGLKAAYPSGVYSFSGTTVGGETMSASSTLSHELPGVASFVRPTPEEEGVSAVGMRIVWTAVAGASGYIVEIEQEDLGVGLETQLPATATSFSVPRGFLAPDTEYDLGIGTMTKEGNISFVETSFTTSD